MPDLGEAAACPLRLGLRMIRIATRIRSAIAFMQRPEACSMFKWILMATAIARTVIHGRIFAMSLRVRRLLVPGLTLFAAMVTAWWLMLCRSRLGQYLAITTPLGLILAMHPIGNRSSESKLLLPFKSKIPTRAWAVIYLITLEQR